MARRRFPEDLGARAGVAGRSVFSYVLPHRDFTYRKTERLHKDAGRFHTWTTTGGPADAATGGPLRQADRSQQATGGPLRQAGSGQQATAVWGPPRHARAPGAVAHSLRYRSLR